MLLLLLLFIIKSYTIIYRWKGTKSIACWTACVLLYLMSCNLLYALFILQVRQTCCLLLHVHFNCLCFAILLLVGYILNHQSRMTQIDISCSSIHANALLHTVIVGLRLVKHCQRSIFTIHTVIVGPEYQVQAIRTSSKQPVYLITRSKARACSTAIAALLVVAYYLSGNLRLYHSFDFSNTVLFWVQMADAMEIMILSILSPALHCEWALEPWQQALIITVSW